MGWNQDWNWNSLGKEEKKDMNAGEKAGEGNSIKASSGKPGTESGERLTCSLIG